MRLRHWVLVSATLMMGCGSTTGGEPPHTDAGANVHHDTGPQCSTLVDTGVASSGTCVYPTTCDAAALRATVQAGSLQRMFMSTPVEVWVVVMGGRVLHGVWDDHPRIEVIDLPTANALDLVWASGPNDVWISGDAPFMAADPAQRGAVFHWDGCRWLQSTPAEGVRVTTLTGLEPGRPWVTTESGLFFWDGAAWQSDHAGFPEGTVPWWVDGVRGGSLYAVGEGARFHTHAIYERVGTAWTLRDDLSTPREHRISFGPGWFAVSPYQGLSRSTTMRLFDRGAWRVLPPLEESRASVGRVAHRVASHLRGESVYYDGETWRHDALKVALSAQGELHLLGAAVASYDSDPLTLEGVRWYWRGGEEGGLVGCRMHAGAVDCIGALEGHFDLRAAP